MCKLTMNKDPLLVFYHHTCMQLHPQMIASIHWHPLALEDTPLVTPTSLPTALHWWLHLLLLNTHISCPASQDLALVQVDNEEGSAQDDNDQDLLFVFYHRTCMQLHPRVVASIHWCLLALEAATLVTPTSSPTALHWWLHLLPLNAHISCPTSQDLALVHRELCSSSPMLVEPTPFTAINLAFKLLIRSTVDNEFLPMLFLTAPTTDPMMALHHSPHLLPSQTPSQAALQWPLRHDIYRSQELEPLFVAIKAINSHLCVFGCKKPNKAAFMMRLHPWLKKRCEKLSAKENNEKK